MLKFDETICAPATSTGTGAISVIRLSGPHSLSIVDNVVTFRKGDAQSSEGYTLKFGSVFDGKILLDEVLVSIFKAPHSYTGEDSAEISCHASSYIVSELLRLLVKAGARMAQPGEFTQRAFLNGKMDLAQAEAVADVIESSSAASHRIAVEQLKGGFSKELASLRDQMEEVAALMELELDFSEEEVEFAERSKVLDLTDRVMNHLSMLSGSFSVGNAIKNGVPVAIVGDVNTGKSTLLNTLVGEDRAIVSPIAGTTRDTVEETMNLNGVTLRFIDTAGIRETDETIERMGIERSLRSIEKAQIVLGVMDVTKDYESLKESLNLILGKVNPVKQKLILLLNKKDLDLAQERYNILVKYINSNVILTDNKVITMSISAKTSDGVNKLREELSIAADELTGKYSESATVTNIRHYEALISAEESLGRFRKALTSNIPTDLAAQDLREAILHIGTITGTISSDDILGRIFSKFCIGK